MSIHQRSGTLGQVGLFANSIYPSCRPARSSSEYWTHDSVETEKQLFWRLYRDLSLTKVANHCLVCWTGAWNPGFNGGMLQQESSFGRYEIYPWSPCQSGRSMRTAS